MPELFVPRPDPASFGPDFGKYMGLVPEGDLVRVLEEQLEEVIVLLRGLPEEGAMVHHAPYTWSIKQVVGHITDCERVFGYRALRMARGDATPLPGFDENDFMRHANFDQWPLEELLIEFEQLRRSHVAMFRHFAPGAWARAGVVSQVPMTVAAMGYVVAGHARHHVGILHKRLGR